MKHKVSALVAVVLLGGSVALGGWLVLSRTEPGPRPASVAGSAGPASASPSPVPHRSQAPAVPRTIVDPLRGRSYCATARLLGTYAQQPYGLDAKLGLVQGKVFDQRLAVVARTYTRLAEQGRTEPRVGARGVRAWRALAASAAATEQTLRVTGLDVHSQVMIVKLATFAKVTSRQLPRATASLARTCGFTAEAVGITR